MPLRKEKSVVKSSRKFYKSITLFREEHESKRTFGLLENSQDGNDGGFLRTLGFLDWFNRIYRMDSANSRFAKRGSRSTCDTGRGRDGLDGRGGGSVHPTALDSIEEHEDHLGHVRIFLYRIGASDRDVSFLRGTALRGDRDRFMAFDMGFETEPTNRPSARDFIHVGSGASSFRGPVWIALRAAGCSSLFVRTDRCPDLGGVDLPVDGIAFRATERGCHGGLYDRKLAGKNRAPAFGSVARDSAHSGLSDFAERTSEYRSGQLHGFDRHTCEHGHLYFRSFEKRS